MSIIVILGAAFFLGFSWWLVGWLRKSWTVLPSEIQPPISYSDPNPLKMTTPPNLARFDLPVVPKPKKYRSIDDE